MRDQWRVFMSRLGGDTEWLRAFDQARDLDKWADLGVHLLGAARPDMPAVDVVSAIAPFASHLMKDARKVDRLCGAAARATWGDRWQGGWAR